MKRILIVMIISVLLTGTAYAGPWHGKGCGMGENAMGMRHGFIRALIHLDLTADQKHEIAIKLKKNREDNKAKFEAMHEAMESLREATGKEVFDEAAVREAYQAVAAAGQEIALQKGRITAELKSLLTPEQLETLAEYKTDMGKHRKARWKDRPRLLDEWIELHSQKGDGE